MIETLDLPERDPIGVDKNLLFGILAVQVDFVTRDQLTDAIKIWVSNKQRPISEVLIEMGVLAEQEHALLLPLVEQHIVNNGGDPAQSLATLSGSGIDIDQWKTLGDDQVDATMSIVSEGNRGTAIEETMASSSTARKTVSIRGNDRNSKEEMAGKRFRIVRPHAKGGLGEVSVAKDLELNRDVALKEIQSRFAHDEGSRSRFMLEAEVTGGLEHPGIVPVYGLGSYEDGRPFYAMRFIQGDSLQEAVDQLYEQNVDATPDFGSVGFRKLLGRFVDVCHAIEYAHSRGVLHRDLKPGNIMLGEYGETLVVDWGLAKMQAGNEIPESETEQRLQPISASGSSATMMGRAIGTPAYMPPEQAAGDLEALGAASDVYSLGATLYYMLTGQVAFQGNPQSVLENVKSGSFQGPREVCSSVPKQLEAICLKAMRQSPADRYASPEALADDVERFLADEPIAIFREPFGTRFRRWARKHQTVVTSSAAVVLVSVAGLAAFSSIVSGKNAALTDLNGKLDSQNSELTAANARAGAAAAAAQASEQRERLERDRAEEALYLSDLRLAASYLQDRQHADAYTGLTNHLPELSNRDRRGWEWYHLLGRAKVSLARWAASPVNVPSIDWSPDGNRLATSHWDATATIIWDAKDGEKILAIDDGTTIRRGVQWHPTENQIAWGAAVDDALVRILDLDTNKLIKLEEYVGSIAGLRWSPDGQRIAISSTNSAEYADANTVVVWEKQDGSWNVLSKRCITEGDGAEGIQWSPDGTELVVVGRDAPTWVLDAESLETLRKTPFRVVTAAWHPTKPQLACGKTNGEVCILDAKTMKVTESKRGAHLGDVSALAWSPDGRFLASGGSDHALRVFNASLNPVSRYVGHSGTVNDITWHPDSKRLASCGSDGQVIVWRREEPAESFNLAAVKQFPRNWSGRAPSFDWLDANTIRLSQSNDVIADIDATSGKVLKSYDVPPGSWRLLSGDLLVGKSDGFQGIEATAVATDDRNATTQFPDAIVIWANDTQDLVATTKVGHRSRIYVHDLRDQREFTLGDEVMFTTMDIDWSNDDRQVITVGCGRLSDGGFLAYAGWIHLFDAETGELISRARVGDERIRGNAGAWSPDSKMVAAGSMNGTCQVYSTPDLTTVWAKPIHRLQVNALSWHPNEPRVASISKDRTLAIWDARTGEVYLRFSLPNTCAHVAWSPDGKRLAALDYGRKIHVWDATTGLELAQSGQLTDDMARRLEQETINSIMAGDLHSVWLSGRKIQQLGGTPDWKVTMYLALAAIQHDDTPTYRRCVEQLIPEAAPTEDAEKTYRCLWVASLAPDSVPDYDRLIRAAEELVRVDSTSRRFHVALAALLMRAGRFDEAKRRLDIASQSVEQEEASPAYYHYVLSMVEFKLGNRKEAIRQRAIADDLCREEIAARPKTDRKAILEILREEAQT